MPTFAVVILYIRMISELRFRNSSIPSASLVPVQKCGLKAQGGAPFATMDHPMGRTAKGSFKLIRRWLGIRLC